MIGSLPTSRKSATPILRLEDALVAFYSSRPYESFLESCPSLLLPSPPQTSSPVLVSVAPSSAARGRAPRTTRTRSSDPPPESGYRPNWPKPSEAVTRCHLCLILEMTGVCVEGTARHPGTRTFPRSTIFGRVLGTAPCHTTVFPRFRVSSQAPFSGKFRKTEGQMAAHGGLASSGPCGGFGPP